MASSAETPWLHRFAVATAGATFVLIWMGGLVTSHGAGMAVPDWPTTYGYNMFFFPPSYWVGGILYEHSHRLVASGVGVLTVILSGWLWATEKRRWLRRLGAIALMAIVVQGVLGGLRVTQMKDIIGVFHATLAQLFFVLVSLIALFTSSKWERIKAQNLSVYLKGSVRYSVLAVTGLILLQLLLGATMRHQHAGLAIPDFPTSYGRLWPAMDATSVAAYNRQRTEATALNPITSGQIALQLAHRGIAFVILLSIASVAATLRRHLGAATLVSRISAGWLALALVQAGLGAATIWTNKAADIATAHVGGGALTLLTGAFLSCILLAYNHRDQPATMVAKMGATPAQPSRPAGLPAA